MTANVEKIVQAVMDDVRKALKGKTIGDENLVALMTRVVKKELDWDGACPVEFVQSEDKMHVLPANLFTLLVCKGVYVLPNQILKDERGTEYFDHPVYGLFKFVCPGEFMLQCKQPMQFVEVNFTLGDER